MLREKKGVKNRFVLWQIASTLHTSHRPSFPSRNRVVSGPDRHGCAGRYAWRESAEKILKSALQGNDTVRGMAVRLIDDLGRRGYMEFGKLLSPSADTSR